MASIWDVYDARWRASTCVMIHMRGGWEPESILATDVATWVLLVDHIVIEDVSSTA